MSKKNIKELSIQVSLNGLSFCILNRSSNTIEYLNKIDFETRLSPFDVLNRLKSELSSNTAFSDDFDDVLVIHHNDVSTLIPKEFYDESCKADYLKFNSKILKTDYITHDDIPINESVNVYVPYININNYIFDTFGEFLYKHASSILIDTCLQDTRNSEDTMVFVHVNLFSIEILVTARGVLHLLNSFDYSTKEDFVYYVLFVYEQLELDPESTQLVLTGRINQEDELYQAIYTYVRHVTIESFKGYKFPENINNSNLHHHYLILNSF